MAEAGTVLLKNGRATLPLAAHGAGQVAVIGPAASAAPTDTGGGSAFVTAPFSVTPLQGIQAAAPGTSVSYNNGSSDSSAASAAAAASVAIVFANLGESEGSDLSGIDLGTSQDNLITAVAAANPNTVVVLNTGSAVTDALAFLGQGRPSRPGTPARKTAPRSPASCSAAMTRPGT